MKRMWFNTPSLHQDHHHLHGTKVLAQNHEGRPGIYKVYFLSGPVISGEYPATSLSYGWPTGGLTSYQRVG